MGFNLDDIRRRVLVDENGCWLWQGGRTKDGYGQVCQTGSVFYTHRVVAALVHGECPSGQEVRHSCDVPPCCNPSHLLYGTRKQNVQDALERGRLYGRNHAVGESHPSAKLTVANVIDIRARREAGETLASISADFDVRLATIHHVVTRKTWKAVL